VEQHEGLLAAACRAGQAGEPRLDSLRRQRLHGHRSKSREELGVEDPAIALDRRGLALAVELDVAEPLRGRFSKETPVSFWIVSSPWRAEWSVSASHSSAWRLVT
jgi:hypothetical protein